MSLLILRSLRSASMMMLALLIITMSSVEARTRKASVHAAQHRSDHHVHKVTEHSHTGRHTHTAHRNTNLAAKHTHTTGNISQGGEGKATIYSDKFNGRKTSTGERFSQGGLTAASPSLPLGSKVRVTNKATGKSVTVRINDRQARGGGRVLDLSKASAKQLGVKGTGHVSTKVLPK